MGSQERKSRLGEAICSGPYRFGNGRLSPFKPHMWPSNDGKHDEDLP